MDGRRKVASSPLLCGDRPSLEAAVLVVVLVATWMLCVCRLKRSWSHSRRNALRGSSSCLSGRRENPMVSTRKALGSASEAWDLWTSKRTTDESGCIFTGQRSQGPPPLTPTPPPSPPPSPPPPPPGEPSGELSSALLFAHMQKNAVCRESSPTHTIYNKTPQIKWMLRVVSYSRRRLWRAPSFQFDGLSLGLYVSLWCFITCYEVLVLKN